MGPRPHALFVTIEFADPLFSGNGTYSRSLVRGLASHGVDVSVVCCVPSEDAEPKETKKEAKKDARSNADEPIIKMDPFNFTFEPRPGEQPLSGAVTVYPVAVPQSKWRKLDRGGPWSEFNKAFVAAVDRDPLWAATLVPPLAATLQGDEAEVDRFSHIFVVDWSAHQAMHAAAFVAMNGSTGEAVEAAMAKTVTFMNFRVFANQLTLPDTEEGRSEFEFYSNMENNAMVASRTTVALCRADAKMLDENRAAKGKADGAAPSEVLLCPVRDEMLAQMADPALAAAEPPASVPTAVADAVRKSIKKHPHAPRCFLVCGVRLSRDKNALLFAQTMAQLQKAGVLDKLGLVPILFGAAADAEYATEVKTLLRESCPNNAVVIDEFLSPPQLAWIFSHAVLNFHPSLYDAYGLSIVEAAIFGAPTLLHCPGENYEAAVGEGVAADVEPSSPVGATDLLKVQREVLGLDFASDVEAVAGNVGRLVDPKTAARLADVAAAGKAKALQWTSNECVGRLLQLSPRLSS